MLMIHCKVGVHREIEKTRVKDERKRRKEIKCKESTNAQLNGLDHKFWYFFQANFAMYLTQE